MSLPTHPIIARRRLAILASILVAGCSSADSRAQAALGEYQAAAASNDMLGARRALLSSSRRKTMLPNIGPSSASGDGARFGR